MINSRNIDDLHPHVAKLCRDFIAACAEAGIDVIPTSTYRDRESQNALYAEGRTAPGSKKTNARGGQSFHNYRLAFDWVPIAGGKARYDDAVTIKRCGVIAESVGLEWAGRWTSFKELVHCQFTGGLTLADLQAGKQIEVVS